ncbi:hypothetical protein [Shewanella youngdeokensis]|uniref:Protein BatD n=1 Tax=Shewanella youngdeokensis TaxID=2999068 RepID=A0ABZ0K410_9GAMM|nr:hypothetical protein RGE70_08150 [Shewanella sp. DAU334]
MLFNKHVLFISNKPLVGGYTVDASLRLAVKKTRAWMSLIATILVLSSLFNMALADSASPTTVIGLQQAGKLKINARVEPGEVVSPQQQVDLYIRISTDTWFGGGARIGPVDITDTLVLRRKKLANNYTERVDGTTWSVQEWQLTLYPQSVGRVNVPVIAVSVNIADTPVSNIKGTLFTEPLTFNVVLPDERLSNEKNWIAAPEVTFEQQLTPKLDHELTIGDAISRTLTIKATDSSAMLFPDFGLHHSEMLQGYLGPVKSEDKQNRGDFSASKVYQQSYIVQKSGEVTLPDLSFYWWNTNTRQLVKLTAAGQSWHVSHTPLSFIEAYWVYGLAAILLVCGLVYVIRWLIGRFKRQQLPVVALFMVSLLQKKWHRVMQYLYWHNADKNSSVTLTNKPALFSHSASETEPDPASSVTTLAHFSRWQQQFSQKIEPSKSMRLTRLFYLAFWRDISKKTVGKSSIVAKSKS